MLAYNYLSSPEKLIEYQARYFENDLIKIDITEIKKIDLKNGNLKVKNFQDNIKVND